VTIGSSCNVCIEKNPWRAAMIRFKPGQPQQLFASGLRNIVGFDCPVYKLPAHVAPLSILFLQHAKDRFADAALVSEHGSWNRSQKIGYEVVALHWHNGQITEESFLTGFLKDGPVLGRPVDIAEDTSGIVFISDDFNGVIWGVAPSR
jgi:glucose/arabinose dehydrogenase